MCSRGVLVICGCWILLFRVMILFKFWSSPLWYWPTATNIPSRPWFVLVIHGFRWQPRPYRFWGKTFIQLEVKLFWNFLSLNPRFHVFTPLPSNDVYSKMAPGHSFSHLLVQFVNYLRKLDLFYPAVINQSWLPSTKFNPIFLLFWLSVNNSRNANNY